MTTIIQGFHMKSFKLSQEMQSNLYEAIFLRPVSATFRMWLNYKLPEQASIFLSNNNLLQQKMPI